MLPLVFAAQAQATAAQATEAQAHAHQAPLCSMQTHQIHTSMRTHSSMCSSIVGAGEDQGGVVGADYYIQELALFPHILHAPAVFSKQGDRRLFCLYL